MSRTLYQMNYALVPGVGKGEPVRQIRNYFFLLTTMMKLGLQLLWEKQHGLKHFDGIMNNAKGREMYDDIVRCVMRPEEETSSHFYPQEIDVIAEHLARRGIKTSEALDYLRIVIRMRMEVMGEDFEGDTHRPVPQGWIAPRPDMNDMLEFCDKADVI
ncbi:MAG TPA: hypothetical protein VHB73_06300 [Alphaproteobacteria bacterium]|nr:hypothetical protein [Alphaproteobacteria bacterium]